MVVIRLARKGAKKSPFYHVVAADKRRARDSKFIENLGFLNPRAHENEERIRLNKERYDYWVAQGAQPSERVLTIVKELEAHPNGHKPKKAKLSKKAKARAAEEAAAAEAAAKEAAEAEATAEEAETAEEAKQEGE